MGTRTGSRGSVLFMEKKVAGIAFASPAGTGGGRFLSFFERGAAISAPAPMRRKTTKVNEMTARGRRLRFVVIRIPQAQERPRKTVRLVPKVAHHIAFHGIDAISVCDRRDEERH